MEPNPKTVEKSMEAIGDGKTQPIKKRLGWFRRWRLRRKEYEAHEYEEVRLNVLGRLYGVVKRKEEKRKGIIGRLFDSERIAKRRKFRVEVSGNRKWIMIGVAVVAVCGTVIYLSVTYGSGIFKILGAFQ